MFTFLTYLATSAMAFALGSYAYFVASKHTLGAEIARCRFEADRLHSLNAKAQEAIDNYSAATKKVEDERILRKYTGGAVAAYQKLPRN